MVQKTTIWNDGEAIYFGRINKDELWSPDNPWICLKHEFFKSAFKDQKEGVKLLEKLIEITGG